MATETTTAEPVVSPLNGWSDAAYQRLAHGELALPYCESCGGFEPPWALFCSDDPGHPLSTREYTGPATVASWVTYQRDYRIPAPYPVPYVVLLAELEDGLRFTCLLARSSDPAGLARGRALTWAVETIEGRPYPAFSFVEES